MANIHYRAHCSNIGWQDRLFDNAETAGTVGENRPLEAYRIESIDVDPGDEVGIAAHAHVQDLGWSDPTPIGQDVGSTGLGKAIEAIKLGLTGKDANKYDLFYRLHIQNYDWLAWSRSPDVNGTTGGAIPAEAIQIILAKKDEHVMPSVISSFEYRDMTPPPKPAPQTSTQNKRAQALALAASYVGYQTGTSKDSVFGRRYDGAYAGDWCCYAVRSICDDCGISFPATGYVPTVEDWAREHGKWTGSVDETRLQAVLFDFNGNATPDHIALVKNKISGGCRTYEGNTGGPNGEPIGFWEKSRTSSIRGYVNLT